MNRLWGLFSYFNHKYRKYEGLIFYSEVYVELVNWPNREENECKILFDQKRLRSNKNEMSASG